MTGQRAELDPLFAQMLEGMARNGMGDGLTALNLPVQQLRDMIHGLAMQARLGPDGAPVGSVQDRAVAGAEGELPARVYRPVGTEGLVPTLVFFHGGGFVVGDLDTHDDVCRLLCRAGRMVVVAVDYRLAPEHPFPAGAHDAVATTRWCVEHADELGGDPAKVAVGATRLAATSRPSPHSSCSARKLLWQPSCSSTPRPTCTPSARVGQWHR